jgi:hypothetical protein
MLPVLIALASASARAQGGPSEAAIGATVAIGIELAGAVKDVVQSYGDATCYVKAKVDGPDTDDRGVDFDIDRDRGLDWSLDAVSGLVEGLNNVDDGEENPYTRGKKHNAYVELHYESTGGVWKPDPDDCIICPAGKKREFYGWAAAYAEDDPTVRGQKTAAAAAAAFSADGKTADFCYQAAVENTGGIINLAYLQKVPCSPIPEFALMQAAVLLLSPRRFQFNDLGGDNVLIAPLVEPEGQPLVVDLFHTYLQDDTNNDIFPVLRGHDALVEELKRDGYTERVFDTTWSLSESPGSLAQLTVVGAALSLGEWSTTRSGRSNLELLEEYFASSAVTVVPPEHAQPGYLPQVVSREVVRSAQDITALVGRDYEIPPNGDPDAEEEVEPLAGVFVSVAGNVDDAVAIGLNADSHFTRQAALDAWDGVSDTVEFNIGSLNFHHETPSSLSAIASADPIEPIVDQFVLDIDNALATGVASKCEEKKIGAASKLASCLLKLEAKKARDGTSIDPTGSQECRAKFTTTFSELDPDCPTPGSLADVETRADLFVTDIDTALFVGSPNKCQANKVKAANKKASCLLKLEAKEAGTGVPVSSGDQQECVGKFEDKFDKLEAKGDCATVGD